ncbi:MAG: TVP38/TMEM64 family protein [Firmicutes bacterium]|nr:TVP38/TMEM64 family protein [Bacillota bacterium]
MQQPKPEPVQQNKKQLRRQRFKMFSAIVKLAILAVLILGIPAYLLFFDHEFLDQFTSIQDIYAFFIRYRSQSILIYLGLQILQIVICIIPGQALQLAAGYVFHFWLGLLLSVAGAALGTIVTYYLAKILGHDAMHMIFGEERIHSTLEKLNSNRGMSIVFLIYLIPGVPKDLFAYAAGLSEMKLKPFLILSLSGRIPGMMGSLLIGHQIQMGGYKAAALIGGIAVVLFLLGLIFRKPLMEFSDKAYDKLRSMM